MSQEEAIDGLLNLFCYAEQHWCEWRELEDKIAEVDYDGFTEKYADWFIEFLANCVLRVWRSNPKKAGQPLNEVEDLGEGYMIKNYDWNSFKFAKQHGLDRDLTTKNTIVVFLKELSEKENKWLRSKCKNANEGII